MKTFANMEEFAAELGLSRSTVSYILNGQWQARHISPKTAKKVLAFAEKVNFTPSLFGRALKGKICTDAAILIPSRMYEHHRNTFFTLLGQLELLNFSYLVSRNRYLRNRVRRAAPKQAQFSTTPGAVSLDRSGGCIITPLSQLYTALCLK